MICPVCGADKDKVIDSRAAENGRVVRRRRECLECNRRFTTYERVEDAIKLTVIKSNDQREPYTRRKPRSGIEQACYKRPISEEQIAQLVETVEEDLHRRFDREVESREIGEIVCDRLQSLDQVAYVRFASVYKQFKTMEEIMADMREAMARPPDTKDQGRLF